MDENCAKRTTGMMIFREVDKGFTGSQGGTPRNGLGLIGFAG
jgi:hypothetical protein